MTLKTIFLTASTVALLSGCADLGFGDLAIQETPGTTAAPVQVAELEAAPVTPAAPAMPVRKVRSERPMPAAVTLAEIEDVRPVRPAPMTSTAGSTVPLASAVEVPERPEPAAVADAREDAEDAGDTRMASILPDESTPDESAPASMAGLRFCEQNVTIPAVTRTETKQVLVSPATTKIETIPATYKTVTERVLVKPATTRTETVPATYKTVTRDVPEAAAAPAEGADGDGFRTIEEKVLVTPETTRTVTIPAEYETVTERVMVRDRYTEWKESNKVYAIGAEALGGTILANQVSSAGVMCLVEFPPEYKTETKRVLVKEEETREEVVPAVYETVTRRVPVEGAARQAAAAATKQVTVRVIDKPATTRTVPVPAEYETVTRRVIDTPAQTKEVPVPAVYREEETEIVVTPARNQTLSVVCSDSQTRDLVGKLQAALKRRDLYTGSIDGLMGPKTREGLAELQDGIDGYITEATVKTLGLDG